jgi:hypothetical protein
MELFGLLTPPPPTIKNLVFLNVMDAASPPGAALAQPPAPHGAAARREPRSQPVAPAVPDRGKRRGRRPGAGRGRREAE